jgi:hypothetical protein
VGVTREKGWRHAAEDRARGVLCVLELHLGPSEEAGPVLKKQDRIRQELDLYEVGGEPLKECARRYGVVARGIEAVKGEIARLESEHPVPGRRSKA